MAHNRLQEKISVLVPSFRLQARGWLAEKIVKELLAACRKMPSFGSRRFLYRLTASVVVTTMVAGGVIAAPASASVSTRGPFLPASARSPMSTAEVKVPDATEGSICLSNLSSYCAAIDGNQIHLFLENVRDLIVIWYMIYKGKDSNNDPEDEPESDGPKDEGECLADTGGYAYMAECGDNGTVWIVVPHNDGDYLYSRYTIDHGTPEVLTADPAQNGSELFVAAAAQSGSPYWQTWNVPA